MRALITGITGQDGRFLAGELRKFGYEIFGTSRNGQAAITPEQKVDLKEARVHALDLQDFQAVCDLLKAIRPDLIFNLAGMSSVSDSFGKTPEYMNANLVTVENILKSILKLKFHEQTRFYQASSSEMFGGVRESPQNEVSKFDPISPYGVSKLAAHKLCEHYRDYEGLFISSGILYNHESEKRNPHFVSRKISKTVAEIRFGISDELVLGNLNSSRDWGYAGDYVKAMHLMLQANEPADFIISTGESHTVLDFVRQAFKAANMEGYEDKYLRSSEAFSRKHDHTNLVGDSSKANSRLGWVPEVFFHDLVARMVSFDLHQTKNS